MGGCFQVGQLGVAPISNSLLPEPCTLQELNSKHTFNMLDPVLCRRPRHLQLVALGCTSELEPTVALTWCMFVSEACAAWKSAQTFQCRFFGSNAHDTSWSMNYDTKCYQAPLFHAQTRASMFRVPMQP